MFVVIRPGAATVGLRMTMWMLVEVRELMFFDAESVEERRIHCILRCRACWVGGTVWREYPALRWHFVGTVPPTETRLRTRHVGATPIIAYCENNE